MDHTQADMEVVRRLLDDDVRARIRYELNVDVDDVTSALASVVAARRERVRREWAAEVHPSWCTNHVGGCEGIHHSESEGIAGTVTDSSGGGGEAAGDSHVSAVRWDDGAQAVSLVMSGKREDLYMLMTPAEARQAAAALVRLADLAEAEPEWVTGPRRDDQRPGGAPGVPR